MKYLIVIHDPTFWTIFDDSIRLVTPCLWLVTPHIDFLLLIGHPPCFIGHPQNKTLVTPWSPPLVTPLVTPKEVTKGWPKKNHASYHNQRLTASSFCFSPRKVRFKVLLKKSTCNTNSYFPPWVLPNKKLNCLKTRRKRFQSVAFILRSS